MKFICRVQNWKNLRPCIRIGQAETFFGFHSGNQMHGNKGAIGFYWNNKNHYAEKNCPILPDSDLWNQQKKKDFIPAEHGRNLFF